MCRKCFFVAYAEFQKGYQCYDPPTDKIYVSLDVSFREFEPYYSGGVLASSLQGESGCEWNPLPSPIIEFEEIEELEERLSSAVKEGDIESIMTFD